MRILGSVLAVAFASLLASTAAAQIILPVEGVVLNQLHAQFSWPKVTGADEYHMQIVEDDLSPDPFLSATPVWEVNYPQNGHRGVVDGGLDWGTDYAWRVRAIEDSIPGAWGATYRFTTGTIPAYVPAITATTTGNGTYEPGLTLFNIRSPAGTVPNGLALAVDQTGKIVWFIETGDKKITDIRLIDEDRMLYIASDRAWEVLLNGQPAWISPLQANKRVHHEAFKMPSGNVLAVVHDYRLLNTEISPGVFEDRWWKGDRFIEFNRNNNLTVWQWSTWDHFSTLDLDDTEWNQVATGPEEPVGGAHPWTHSNSVIYNQDDDSVYVSVRNLNRITRIDRSTGDVVYNMGFTSPSGDDDFGDNLFSFQHAPQMLANGNMVLYDNGARRDHVVQTATSGVTKAIELSFTGNPPTSASIVWEWTTPNYQRIVGDADRLPGGNTLVVEGTEGIIYEVASNGDIVWQMDLPTGTPDHVIYRAERIPYLVSNTANRDSDGDGITDYLDNCPDHENVGQNDRDGDGFGDVCARAFGVGVFALPSLQPVGFGLLVLVLMGVALAALRVTRRA